MPRYGRGDPELTRVVASVLLLAGVPLLTGAAPDAEEEAQPKELHRGIEYQGAAGFMTLSDVTVVYPAGIGENVQNNRRSAEARARWLAGFRKGKVAVAADDQLTDEQRKGNVLVLGWNNRFFDPPGPERPYKHDHDGSTFLGITEPDPTVDLLVFHRNPLNWSSYVLFWSRIDPERDRFQIVPRLGSDWGMFRDYRPVRQGMFVPARVWPPSRDKVAEADHTGEGRFRPGGTSFFDSPHYHVVYDRTLFREGEIRSIAQTRESAFAKAESLLAPAPEGFRIQLGLYTAEDNKLEASGVGDPSHALPAAREIHMIRRYAASATPREEIHVLARQLYGPCFITAIYEGLAISAEKSFKGEDIELIAAEMGGAGHLPRISDLLDEERFRRLPDDARTAAAGVLMTWIRQTFGPAGVKKIYGTADRDEAGFAAALGLSVDAATASFAGWATALAAAHKPDLDFETAEREAQRMRTMSDWNGMAAALRKALAAKPGDPQTTINLASAQMRGNDLAGAEATLKQLLKAKLPPSDLRFTTFGHYQLGRVYDLEGRRKEALAEYDAVLALPDDHNVHSLALERKNSPATRDQLE